MCKSRKYTILIGLLALLLHARASASPQKDSLPDDALIRPRFEYGMILGMALANAATANYYNGSGEYSLQDVLNQQYYYNAIRRDIGYDFSLHALPGRMHYQPAMMMGFYAGGKLGKRLGLNAACSYAKFRAQDRFTLRIDRYSSIGGDNIELFSIWGLEERVELSLSLKYHFLPHNSIQPFFAAGFSLTDTRVKENRVRIYSQTISIRNPRDRYYQLQDSGIGPGYFANLGISMQLPGQLAVSIIYRANNSRVNLGNNKQYSLQQALFLSMNLGRLLQD